MTAPDYSGKISLPPLSGTMTRNSNSPRVCYVASPQLFSKGAYALHAARMCEAMDGLGVEFEAVFPGRFDTGGIFEYYGVRPFNLTSLPFTKYAGRQLTHGAAGAFYALANRHRFDMVLTLNIICAAILAKTGGLPVVYDAHHPPVGAAGRALFRLFQGSENLAAVSFNSGGLRRIYLEGGLDERKTVVAHNGVETGDFENRPAPEEIRKQLGIPTGRPVVCYCGNTYEGRGIEDLIEMADGMRDALFLVVGGRDRDNTPHKRAAERRGVDNFVMKGFVPHSDVPLYLLASDVLVMPYTDKATIRGGTVATEFTSPMKLFEYMAAGKPIVAASIPTALEILEDGENCALAPPGDRREFARAIRRCVDDEDFARRIARAAREKAEQYTWKHRAEKILSFAADRLK